jgi:prepilin-type N-terminal cleavage/methylation domain-containing protein
MNKNSKGFSLVELLIVVAVILTIVAIAIPNLLRSRIAANQSSAVASLHTLNIAETTYTTTYGMGYSSDMLSLAAPATSSDNPSSAAAGLIDNALAAGVKSGYDFTYSPGAADGSGHIDNYSFTANPVSSSTGTQYYYTDESGVTRENTTTSAGSTDMPVGN